MNGRLKWQLAFAFLLVFVAGAASGGLFSSMHMRHRFFFGPPHSGEMGDRFREHITRMLDLTPEQSAKITPIIDATAGKLEAIRIETAQRVRSTMEESERQISPDLTPDQLKKLQEMKSNHQRMLMHHGFMPPPPPPPEDASPSP